MAKKPAPEAVEPLTDYIARVEVAHLARDVVAVQITHPDATERVHPVRFGGIRLAPGPVSVTYSDGTKN